MKGCLRLAMYVQCSRQFQIDVEGTCLVQELKELMSALLSWQVRWSAMLCHRCQDARPEVHVLVPLALCCLRGSFSFDPFDIILLLSTSSFSCLGTALDSGASALTVPRNTGEMPSTDADASHSFDLPLRGGDGLSQQRKTSIKNALQKYRNRVLEINMATLETAISGLETREIKPIEFWSSTPNLGPEELPKRRIEDSSRITGSDWNIPWIVVLRPFGISE